MKKQIYVQQAQAPNKPSTLQLYAANGTLVKEFITKSDDAGQEQYDKRQAKGSKFGYIVALHDGYISDGQRRLEIIMPDSSDLSINQSGGFSLFMWVLFKKTQSETDRYIIKKGSTPDEMTPCVGLFRNRKNIFVKISTSRHKVETLLSNKGIDMNRMYNIVVTFSIDYINDLTDISLYLDGLLDSQITIPGEPIHNQGNIYIGKIDSISHGFVGCVADIILTPRVLQEKEIYQISKASFINLYQYKAFKSYQTFERKMEHDLLLAKYSHYTGISLQLLENMDMVNDELREIVRKYEEHEDKSENNNQEGSMIHNLHEEHQIVEQLKDFLKDEESLLSITVKKIYLNHQFLYTVMYLVAQTQDELEAKRMITVLSILEETIHIKLDEKDLSELARILRSFQNPNIVKLVSFFKSIKYFIPKLFEDLNSNERDHGYTDRIQRIDNRTSVELHENLLLSTQNFKNYIDEDLERDLAKSSFTIRSLYSRGKSARPGTSKVIQSGNNDGDDVVNHDMREEKIQEVQEEMENENQKSNAEFHNDLEQGKENSSKAEDAEKGETYLEFDHVYKDSEGAEKNNDQEVESASKQKEENKSVQEPIQSRNETVQEAPDLLNSNYNKTSPKDEEQKSYSHAIENEKDNTQKANERSEQLNHNDEPYIKDNAIENGDVEMEENESPTNDFVGSKNALEAKFPQDWNMGAFEVIINFCYDCHLHQTTTRHCEYWFVDKFNEIADSIRLNFPNCRILGNSEKPEYLGVFDIYLRGVGASQDNQGRFFIFRKKEAKCFPNSCDIGDKLIALVMLYGSSINLEAAQTQFKKAYRGTQAKNPRRVDFNDSPATLGEEAEKHKSEYERSKIKPVIWII